MNSAEYVNQQIQEMKASGIPLSEAAWKAAQLTVGWPYVFGDRGCYCTPGNRQTAYNRTAAGKNKDNIKLKCQVLNGSKGSCSGCKWYPDGKRVREFDCRGFTYWILLQVFGWKLEGVGCTSQWNKESNWQKQGEIADGIPQDVIVCVFYYEKDKSGKRTDTLAHTGLYYNGETIECSNGVEYSKTLNKKWDVWGVPACVGGVTPVTHKTLKRGDKGPEVVELQMDLIQLNYDLGTMGADGIYGKRTEQAVRDFQGVSGLKQDGICGPKTWDAIEKALEPQPGTLYTVIIPHLTEKQAEDLLKEYPDGEKRTEGSGS